MKTRPYTGSCSEIRLTTDWLISYNTLILNWPVCSFFAPLRSLPCTLFQFHCKPHSGELLPFDWEELEKPTPTLKRTIAQSIVGCATKTRRCPIKGEHNTNSLFRRRLHAPRTMHISPSLWWGSAFVHAGRHSGRNRRRESGWRRWTNNVEPTHSDRAMCS